MHHDGSGSQPRPHRPARYADLTGFIDAAGGETPISRAELAATTAELVVRAGRSPGENEVFVELADRVGLDTLAALWRDAEPVSLAGALWTLYVLRQWCRTDAVEVARLWRAGEYLSQADAAVAGVGSFADADAVHRVADAILSGAYHGEFDVALERAAAFFRVVAIGRAQTGEQVALAAGNIRAADALGAAATLWRKGGLH